MADVKIRNLEDHVVDAYKQRAEAQGRSLEEELRQTLRKGLSQNSKELADELREFQKRMFGDRVLSDSTDYIRAQREGIER